MHARQILRDVDRMRADLSDYAQGATGRVRLHANASAMGQFLPDDVASFRQRYPEIRVSVEEHRSVYIVQAIRDRQADVGVITSEAADPALNFIPYRTDRLVAIVREMAESSSRPTKSKSSSSSNDTSRPRHGCFCRTMATSRSVR